MDTSPNVEERLRQFSETYGRITDEVGRVIVGHEEVLEGVLVCLLTDGHAILEGVPGIGKTLLVRTLAEALDLEFRRIQFTPDLMPADIVGTNVIIGHPDGRRDGVLCTPTRAQEQQFRHRSRARVPPSAPPAARPRRPRRSKPRPPPRRAGQCMSAGRS